MTNRNRADLGRAVVALAALLICGCGSPAPAPVSHAPTPTVGATCQQVSAVLSDGPDPDADPVGYAEAQILPLRRINARDQVLRDAINQLADAYQQFFASNGKSSSAKEAVAVASNKLNSICPGAAS